MGCFKKGKGFNKNNIFLNKLKEFDEKRNFKSDDIVFITKDSIDEFANIDINLVLLSNVPSFDEFREYSKKYPNKIKAYINSYAHENHFSQIVNTIIDGNMWLAPNVKKVVDKILEKKSNILWKVSLDFVQIFYC